MDEFGESSGPPAHPDFGGSGISNRQAYASTAMHELGHAVGCDYNTNLENAFKIKYVGAEASAALNKAAANPVFVAAYLKTTVGGANDLDYDLRSTSYDTLQELVNDINAKADYDATLDGTPAQTPILLYDYTNLNLPKNTDVQIKNYNDDYSMLIGFSPDRSTNLEFHQTWAKSIPDMDVANHY